MPDESSTFLCHAFQGLLLDSVLQNHTRHYVLQCKARIEKTAKHLLIEKPFQVTLRLSVKRRLDFPTDAIAEIDITYRIDSKNQPTTRHQNPCNLSERPAGIFDCEVMQGKAGYDAVEQTIRERQGCDHIAGHSPGYRRGRNVPDAFGIEIKRHHPASHLGKLQTVVTDAATQIEHQASGCQPIPVLIEPS